MPDRHRILLVEDNPDDAELFLGTFGAFGPFDIAHVGTLAQAMARVAHDPPDIVLLDLGLPDSDGIATLTTMLPAARNVPITVMTGQDDEDLAVAAVRAGAQDYLVKGFVDNRTMTRLLRHAMERHHLRTALKAERDAESYRATHDPLTGLANRALFFDRLEHILARGLRYRESFAVAFIDLDRFKPINDRYGHEAGDKVLAEFATRLRTNTRSSDTLARVGGDEFAILMERIENRNDADHHCRELVDGATAPIQVGGDWIPITASFGVALYPEDGIDPPALLRAADTAMYRRKHAGRPRG
ncbi:MAG: diguanylate cyclase [Gemmatimonadales bacterium]